MKKPKFPVITVNQWYTLVLLMKHLRYPASKVSGGTKRDVTLLQRKGLVRYEYNSTDKEHVRVTSLGFDVWDALGGDKQLESREVVSYLIRHGFAVSPDLREKWGV